MQLAGSRQQLNLAGSGLVNYLYDAAGRPQSMTHPLGSASWAHFDNNWTQRRTLNGVAYTDYLYNPIGMLTRLTNKNSAGTLTHSDYTGFTYDGVFNLTGLTASVPGTPSYSGTSTFGYDTKDRLTGDQSTKIGGYNHSFGYDDSFNPTTFKGVSQSFNSNNQQTGAPFVYDLNGNPTTYKGTACTFDPENRLTSYGAILTAGYRADGMRAWKQNSSGRTYFIYDGITPVLELDNAGALKAINLFAPDGLVARSNTGGDQIYYTFDPQSDVANRLNNTGALFSNSTFDAYGVETRTSQQNDPWGYSAKIGYYKDQETGLYLCTYRYYDPEKGRWVNRDPIGQLGGINVYAYCWQRPTFFADNLGLKGFVESFGELLDDVVAGALRGLLGAGGSSIQDPNGTGVTITNGNLIHNLLFGGNAVTLQDCIVIPGEVNPLGFLDSPWYKHEMTHREQWRKGGFLPAYAGGALQGALQGNAHDQNPYEQEADGLVPKPSPFYSPSLEEWWRHLTR